VYKNICDSSQDTPHAKWTRLRTLFLDVNETEFLSNARTNLLECKQGPDVDIVEHTGEFNSRLRILRDLKDKSVEDPDWVFTIFKASLNITYTKFLGQWKHTNETWIMIQQGLNSLDCSSLTKSIRLFQLPNPVQMLRSLIEIEITIVAIGATQILSQGIATRVANMATDLPNVVQRTLPQMILLVLNVAKLAISPGTAILRV